MESLQLYIVLRFGPWQRLLLCIGSSPRKCTSRATAETQRNTNLPANFIPKVIVTLLLELAVIVWGM
jgi:hypothetical protein